MKPQPQSAERSTVECEEMNDFGVEGRDMSQIHIHNQMDTLTMSKSSSVFTTPVKVCVDNRPVQELGLLS